MWKIKGFIDQEISVCFHSPRGTPQPLFASLYHCKRGQHTAFVSYSVSDCILALLSVESINSDSRFLGPCSCYVITKSQIYAFNYFVIIVCY